MTSERKAAANRLNAKRSTGPRSNAGRRRASRNALKHGLAATWTKDSFWSEKHASLAEALSAGAQHQLATLACSIADIEFQIVSIRSARAFLVNKFVSDQFMPQKQPDLVDLSAGRKHPNPNVVLAIDRLLRKLRKHYNSEAKRFSSEYSASIDVFAAFDRYENRAMQQRKRYIRAYEAYRATTDCCVK